MNFTQCRSAILAVSVAVSVVGCNPSSQVATTRSEDDQTTDGTVASDILAPSSESVLQQHTEAPKLDEGSVNSEGQIVLGQAETEASENATQASSESAQPNSNSSQTASVIDPPQPAASAASDSTTLASSKTSVVNSRDRIPVEANVATEAERNQKIAADWPEPQAVIFVSGQQHGYLEPCGCTGLENQKGGLIRRDTLLQELRARGWEIIPVDVGNQVRRIGRQAEIKFQSTVEAFKMMDYRAATLGIDDLKLSSIELIQAASSDELNPGAFILANVDIIDSTFFPKYRIVEAGGRKIGITAALGSEHVSEIQSEDVKVFDAAEKLKPIVRELKEKGCDFLVLLAHSSLEGSARMAQQVPGFDLIVTAGGFGEPTLHPEKIDGSDAVMVQVGTKGMFSGIIGLFDDKEIPLRYQKIAISSQFQDSSRMMERFAEYQERLKDAGYSGLGATPAAHPTDRKFVGSEVCGDCHTTAFEIWEGTPHAHATDSVVAPPNDRGGIARHYDPECISCHATGWNAQRFFPYDSGFVDPETTQHLTGSGCENCHGPGRDHVDAENGDVDVDNETLLMLQQQMVLKLDHARDKCLECHDLDNSPDFLPEGAFDEYWEKIKHYGKD